MDFLILLTVFSLGIAFLFFCYKILIPFFHNINNPLNTSTRFLLLLTMIGFGFLFYEFSLRGVQVLQYYFEKSLFISGLVIYSLLLTLAFCSAMAIFRLTNGLINIISKENIKAELIKNNYLIAGQLGLFFLILLLLLKTPLLNLALKMIG